MLRVRQFCGIKGSEGCAVVEQSYMGNLLSHTFCAKGVGEPGMNGIAHMLRHYGYHKNLYQAIVPWNKDIPCNETYKRLWRNDDVREIFKGLGIEPKKSLSRMLLKHINDEDHPQLPLLQSIKFLWNLCQDENLLVEVWPSMCKNFSSLWEIDKDYLKAWNCMVKGWPKSTKMMFARSLDKLSRPDYNLWTDVLRMTCNVYRALGKVEVRGKDIETLHNNLIEADSTVASKKKNEAISYEKDFLKIHKFAFHNKVGAYELILPIKTHDIVTWGKKLSNCMAGYIGSVVNRSSTLIGVVDKKDNKLIVGLELINKKISQMSGYANSHVDPILKLAILEAMMDVGAINTIAPSPSTTYGNWYAMTRQEREALEKQVWLPGIQPTLDIGVFNEQHDNRNQNNRLAVIDF